MANWTGGILTDLGRELQAKVESGTPLKVTCFKLGDGTETASDAQGMSNLLAPKVKFGITGIERKGTLCTFTGVITSSKVSAGFRAREWGLFAEDPDRGEILYMVALDDRPDYIAAQDSTLNSTITYALNIDISSTAEITPVIDAAGLVSVDTLEKAAGLVRRSTAYALKNIAYDIQLSNYPSWRLVCTKAGTTGETILNLDGAKLGSVYTDGTAEWTVQDVYSAVIDDHDKNKDAHSALQSVIDDTLTPTADENTIRSLLSNLANRVKAGAGTSGWKDAPATTLASLATLASNLASGSDVTWEGNKFTNAKLGIAGLMAQNGYICFGPNFGGLILQWGLESSNVFRGTVTYPIQFPNTVWCTFLNDPDSAPEAIQAAQIVRDIMPYSKTGFQFFERQVANNSGLACDEATAFWLSIGY